ncbi:hypothetical protein MUP01_08665 [Candidatus Bathyarchaeota archaeon]|nr:hypothetical protein [Candidatus Bathyarchaeota archaeon]
MPNKSFGTPMEIKTKQLVETSAEIPQGQWAYVVNASTLEYDTIWDRDWEKFLAGDMSRFKTEIEKQLPGSSVEWVNFVWDKTEKSDAFFDVWEMRWKFAYHVYGLKVEAIVKNVNGGITGMEVIGILTAAATLIFAIAIFALVAIGTWVVFQVMEALKKLGPAATAIGGILILGGIGLLLFVIFGGKAKYEGKKRRFQIGRG